MKNKLVFACVAMIFLFSIAMMSGCGGKASASLPEKTAGSDHAPEKDAHGHERDEHGHEADHAESIRIGQEAQDIMGLQNETVQYRHLEEILAVIGEVGQDTDKTQYVAAGRAGTVDEIRARHSEVVKAGDVLATVRDRRSGETVDVSAPGGGLVISVTSAPGQTVDEITPLFSIADLSTVYANFDVAEKDAGLVRLGQTIRATAEAFPDQEFHGKITYVSPRVDDKSRTVKIRAEMRNPDYRLKFCMFLKGKLVLSSSEQMAVSRKAVQWAEGKDVVFVRLPNGDYQPREVGLGQEQDGFVQIVQGLSAGETVATEGSFLLKSEKLKSKMGDGCAD